MKFHFLLLITFSLILLSCSKEKSHRWMVADITVLDYYTHQPVSYTAIMSYTDASGFGQATTEKDNLGTSDEYGHLKVEDRISRQQSGFKLKLFSDSYYNRPYGGGDGPMPAYEKKLDIKGANKIKLYLKQYRLFNVHLINTNCSGVTDSLWINSPNAFVTTTYLFTGCEDITFFYGGQDYNYTQDQSVTFHLVSKKNGIVSISDQTFNLVPGGNDIEIDY